MRKTCFVAYSRNVLPCHSPSHFQGHRPLFSKDHLFSRMSVSQMLCSFGAGLFSMADSIPSVQPPAADAAKKGVSFAPHVCHGNGRQVSLLGVRCSETVIPLYIGKAVVADAADPVWLPPALKDLLDEKEERVVASQIQPSGRAPLLLFDCSSLCFRIDSQQQFGQIRPLNPDIVRERLESLNQNPPCHLLRLVTYLDPSMPLFWRDGRGTKRFSVSCLLVTPQLPKSTMCFRGSISSQKLAEERVKQQLIAPKCALLYETRDWSEGCP